MYNMIRLLTYSQAHIYRQSCEHNDKLKIDCTVFRRRIHDKADDSSYKQRLSTSKDDEEQSWYYGRDDGPKETFP